MISVEATGGDAMGCGDTKALAQTSAVKMAMTEIAKCNGNGAIKP